ncbi:hypothetical protein ACIQVK_19225 [Streptomyces sp. NPDC090493]|uniref:hypothetical protein n=1 Tax=Streptomyces sp. NPDC090493 TaxID=3365964 RepID=UPI00382ADFB0
MTTNRTRYHVGMDEIGLDRRSTDMATTRDMRAVMRQYDLTETMVRAISSGADDAVIDCNWRTEAALVERRLMHRTMSNLTPKGRDVLAALKASQGVIEQATPAAVETPTPMSDAMQRNVDAANDALAGVDLREDEAPAPGVRPNPGESTEAAKAIFTTPRPERLRDDRSYAIQWGTDDGKWHGSIVSSAMSGRDEVDTYVADVQALADPGVTVRAVEIRLTHTVLPAPGAAQPADVDHGPVAARTLRSGCRVNLFDTERLIYRVEYRHAGNYLQLHTVPPAGEHPGYFVFTKSPHNLVELISRGPAVDITGKPVHDAS